MNALSQVSEMQWRQVAGRGATSRVFKGEVRGGFGKEKGQLARVNWPFVVICWQDAFGEITSARYAAKAAAKLCGFPGRARSTSR